MKTIPTLSLLLALSVSGAAVAQSGDMGGMKDKGMDMKSMDMKGDKASKDAIHETSAVVKKADPEKGKVTLAHEPVPSLSWPAMTMAFQVKDKALFDKLNAGKKVDVEFVKEGSNYVVTSVK
jgi:Cu(I)/Ag(I) efflux system protein CusF